MKWPQEKKMLSKEEREELLRKAHYNLFALNSPEVYIDLLTDSGTGRMSRAQWEALRRGDESYAGSVSSKKLRSTIRRTFCMPYIRLVHQGRAAEDIFNSAILTEPGMVVLGNTPFDTTRAHIESRGGIIVDCTRRPVVNPLAKWSNFSGFLGNVNTIMLATEIIKARKGNKKIAYVLITATCNSTGGHPVSLGNIRQTACVAHAYRIPVLMDLARYAENAYFIKKYEPECKELSIAEIIKEMASAIDGILASGKKDALGNIGGFLAFKSERIPKKTIETVVSLNVLGEGLDGLERFDGIDEEEFTQKLHSGTLTPEEEDKVDFIKGYGGMSGRDMEALNQGIKESLDERYLGRRIAQVRSLARGLYDIGLPVLPPGGHAVFIDAGQLLRHINWEEFPGYALAIALYSEGGIRSVEVGSLMLGRDLTTHENRRAGQELTRLAIPRRVYTKNDMEYVISVLLRMRGRFSSIRPVTIMDETKLRHFDSTFA